ncbi:hypothetical protein J1N35_033600 [Gossypium stocksii]|uniref:SWIM-type domain-containing protein n=1 Tax=Gossypium stocksii TaxID=47602 RepID=A0A9D3UQY7_9ROSI|nr:hypothetical protein J1N35_033600 [Gossypium stocksii]
MQHTEFSAPILLRRHVCPQPNIYVISDRGTEILVTIERQRSLWDHKHHWYCLRHVTSNYYGQYRSTNERRVVCNFFYQFILPMYEINNDRFHEMLAILRSTQAYDDSLQYGHMTSNLAECINSSLKETCHLLITSVVRETNFHLVALFPKQVASYKGQMQGGHVWWQKVLQEINKVKAWTNTMHTFCHDHNNLWFCVMEFDRLNQSITGKLYPVHLRNKTCDCRTFAVLCYPCAHAIIAC